MIVVVQCKSLIDGGCDIREWLCQELSFVIGPYSRLQCRVNAWLMWINNNPDLIVNKLFFWFIFFKCPEEAHNVGILAFGKVTQKMKNKNLLLPGCQLKTGIRRGCWRNTTPLQKCGQFHRSNRWWSVALAELDLEPCLDKGQRYILYWLRHIYLDC